MTKLGYIKAMKLALASQRQKVKKEKTFIFEGKEKGRLHVSIYDL